MKRWINKTTGMGTIYAELPIEAYEQFLTAMDAAMHVDRPDTPAAEGRSREQRQADAFIDLIGACLRAGDLGTSQGVKPHLTVFGSIDSIIGRTEESATTNYGHRLSPEALRRIACDASLTRAILSGTGQVLDIVCETRQWTVAHYRAAAFTFGGCAFPVADGEPCGRPMSWTDLHHVTYWQRGGRTDMDNATPLCRRHHTIVHHRNRTLTYHHPTLTVTLKQTQRDGTTTTRTVSFARQARTTAPVGADPTSDHGNNAHPDDVEPRAASGSGLPPNEAEPSPPPASGSSPPRDAPEVGSSTAPGSGPPPAGTDPPPTGGQPPPGPIADRLPL